eukprot:NODE_2958_length_2115_cov_5.062877.p1 GENE.NODE_2958_length_2115_cov_5.062877~~NODE_2958_length_2115_cov_5.062877.p1  ORF type:complete len:690 (+),score=200.71 NODE_2958_length_2115_cov_5.062877:174-2072(+)
MLHMQSQQRAAAAGLGLDLSDDDVEDAGDAEEGGSSAEGDDWQCASCREGSTWERPLALVAHVVPSNLAKFHGGCASAAPRFAACGHQLHVECYERHAATVRTQLHRVLQVLNVRHGEIPCPMCRSFSSCALPCLLLHDSTTVHPKAVLPAGTARCSHGWSEAMWQVAWQAREPSAMLRRSLASVVERAACAVAQGDNAGARPVSVGFSPNGVELLLTAAMMELAIATSLSPIRLAETDRPAVYGVLLRCALASRALQPCLSGSSAIARLLKSPIVRLDCCAALATALVDGLCSGEGLSQRDFTELVTALLHVRALQLAGAALATGGGGDAAAPPSEPGPTAATAAEGLTPEAREGLAKGLTAFLVFAAWLAAAIWRFPVVDRQRLARLSGDGDDNAASALQTAASLLRIPGVSSVADVLALQPSTAHLDSGSGDHGGAGSGASGDAVATPPVPAGRGAAELSLPALPGNVDWALARSSLLVPFVTLPMRYLDLIRAVYRRRCVDCDQEPCEPALCLLCNAVVCMYGHPGGGLSRGTCTAHAWRCGAGQCLFMLPWSSKVLAVSAPACSYWDAPYVDAAGEPDPNLQRACGLELTLSATHLDELRRIYTTATIQQEILRHNERTHVHVTHPV